MRKTKKKRGKESHINAKLVEYPNSFPYLLIRLF